MIKIGRIDATGRRNVLAGGKLYVLRRRFVYSAWKKVARERTYYLEDDMGRFIRNWSRMPNKTDIAFAINFAQQPQSAGGAL